MANNPVNNPIVGPLAGADFEDENTFDGYSTAGLEELVPNDYPGYFVERNHHLFHSHGNSPYPLPVDTPEQQVRYRMRPPTKNSILTAFHFRG